MILPDRMIRERLADRSLGVSPIDDDAIQPASIDLTLGDSLKVWSSWVTRDPRIDQSHLWSDVALADSEDAAPVWVLDPGWRYLAVTEQEVRLPADLCGQLSARSSWGRDGLDVIQGPAGWIDPGWRGRLTLELSVSGSSLVIWPGASCLQLVLYQMAAPACRPYGHRDRTSKYLGDWMPTPSRREAP